jgi:hypothetical protein
MRRAFFNLSRLAAVAGGVAGALTQPALAGPISARLPTFETKDLVQPLTPVTIWPAPNRTPALPTPAERMDDGSLLVRLTPAQIGALIDDPAVAYAAPQEEIFSPTVEETPRDPGAGGTSKGLRLGRPSEVGGLGVKIGIIDFGLISSGQPAATAVAANEKFGVGDFGGGHLDEVADIIHRNAPGARLLVASLPSRGAAPIDVVRAARWLQSQGVRIINFSGVIYQSRRDGRAELDQLVDRLATRGILWVSAAGNEAERTWNGLTKKNSNGLIIVSNSSAPTVDPASLALWATGGQVSISVTWDDWGAGFVPHGDWNVSIVLLDDADRQVGYADYRRRLGIGEPVQTLARNLAPGRYKILLPASGSGSPCLVHVVATGAVSHISPATPSGSVGEPGTALNAFTVGAVAPPNFVTAAYSGRGPTVDGRRKPDMAALGAYEGRVGTSYAAPRVTALAARLLANQPGLSVAGLKREILAQASKTVGATRNAGDPPVWIDEADLETAAR